MVVATDADLASIERDIIGNVPGFAAAPHVVIQRAGPELEEIERALEAAVANARAIGIEDIFISDALSGHASLEQAVQAFGALPAGVHLSAGGLVGRFKHPRVFRFGKAAARPLLRLSFVSHEATIKRWFDIAVSAAALVLLSPLFGLIALLIKLDSPGPVFFKQRRRGYSAAEFRIWKFRTMMALESGDTVKQVAKGYARTTYIGTFLRRFSLDGLPQLINVLKGEMSLVGPRPHAIAYDRFFASGIASYPKPLNVKPGMTGWAQVNGFRGATNTDEGMQQRVERDIYRIDNCSLGFDLYILLLTLISPKAGCNAHRV